MTVAYEALNRIQESLRDARKRISAAIPEAFGWWLELDHEVRLSVRWIWLGHPAVTHCGGVTDYDITIVMMFLEDVDWEAEVSAAMAGIENAESLLLQTAQKKRRLRLSDVARVNRDAPALVQADSAPEGTLRAKMRDTGPLEVPQRRMSREAMEKRLAAAGFTAGRKSRKPGRQRAV